MSREESCGTARERAVTAVNRDLDLGICHFSNGHVLSETHSNGHQQTCELINIEKYEEDFDVV